MTDLSRAQVTWTGPPGFPAVSSFYYKTSDGVNLTALKAFFEAIKNNLPTSITLKYPGFGTTLDDTTGDTTGTWSAAAPADTVGTAAGGYSGVTGTCLTWHTGIYTGGRELKGRTFLVPLASICFNSDGRLQPATQASLKTAADALHPVSGGIQVYSPTKHTSAPVQTTKVPLMPVFLSSRRGSG